MTRVLMGELIVELTIDIVYPPTKWLMADVVTCAKSRKKFSSHTVLDFWW